MLTGSVQLSLLMGPAVAVPVPKPVIEALERVEIRTGAGETGGFSLTFGFSTDSPLTTLLLLLGQIGPVIRTVLFATVNGLPTPMIDGVVTHHQISPDIRAGKSTLAITGEDLTVVMDQIDMTGIPYPAMPPFARVNLILAKYAMFGIVPLVIPSVLVDVPIPIESNPDPSRYRPRLHPRARRRGRLRVLHRARSGARDEHRLLGSRDQGRGAAAGAERRHGRPHTTSTPLSFTFSTGRTRPCRSCSSRMQQTKVPIPIPIPPDANSAQPAARR